MPELEGVLEAAAGLEEEVAEDQEEGLEAETIQEVIKVIGRDMAEEVLTVQVRMAEEAILTGQGLDFMQDQGHLNTGQGLMAEEVLQGMEGQDRLGEGIDYISLLNWS